MLGILIVGCKPCEDFTNPDCPNYISCENGEIPVIADFGIGGKLVLPANQFHDTLVYYLELDTVLTGLVRFWTKESYGKETWTIENDTYTDADFVVDFPSSYHGKEIEIDLDAFTYLPCLLDEDRRDSKTKNVIFRNYTGTEVGKLPIHGDFEGSFSDDPEVFIITINENGIQNLGNNCYAASLFYQYYDRFFIEGINSSSSCYDYYSEGNLSEDRKTVTIEMQIEETDGIVNRTFKGSRIN